MNKNFVRMFLYGLAVLVLMVNATGVAANPVENGGQEWKVFRVKPNGTDDTDNILQAFVKAKAAGPGSTVQLAAGKFFVRIGVIEVVEFNGAFKGAGQNKTIIDTFENQNCQPLIDLHKWPTLVYFMRGYPRISDLSFHITPSAPCLPYFSSMDLNWRGTSIFPLVVASSPWNENDCAKLQPAEKVSASIERITIEGQDGVGNSDDPILKSNIYEALWLGGMMRLAEIWGTGCYQMKFAQGEFRVVQSTFRHALIGMMVTYLYNSQALIGGNQMVGNTFDENIYGAYQNDSSGSNFMVAHNHLEHIYGCAICLNQGRWSDNPYIQTASNFTYLNNNMAVEGGGNGFTLLDYDNLDAWPYPPTYPSTGSRAHVVVQNNKVSLKPGLGWGIWIEGLDDPKIHNNVIKGSGDLAIAAGPFWGTTRHGVLTGNDLNEFTPANAPIKILLGSGTKNYIVTGVPAEAVDDNGTDNLIGGKKIQYGGPHSFVSQADQRQKMDKMMQKMGRAHLMQP
jgi:hypothetical protein